MRSLRQNGNFKIKTEIISIKLNNILVCFYSFYLPCHILEKDNFIKKLYFVLSCLIK